MNDGSFKKSFTALTVTLVAVLCASLLCACGILNNRPGGTVPEATHDFADPTDASEGVYAFFYDRGEAVGRMGPYEKGTVLESVDYTVNPDAANEYTLLGWDCDGDGIAESFPFTLNSDVTFTAILDIRPILYHYDIYVRGEKLRSADCHYGDPIDYPEVQSFFEGETAYLFLGWKYDGVFDWTIREQVSGSAVIEAYFAESQVLTMYIDDTVRAQYVNEGEPIPSAEDLGVDVRDGYELVWYTDPGFKNRADASMPEGNLTVYGSYEPLSDANVIRVNSKSQLLDLFNSMLLDRRTSLEVFFDCDCGKLEDIPDYLASGSLSLYGYTVSISSSDSRTAEITVKYSRFADRKSSKIYYTQLPSANVTLKKSDRSADFDDFAVNKINETLTVNNSEALFYALENGLRPLIAPSSGEVGTIYETMKAILREYVSDSMTDKEKAAAIYEYLVMSVVYDGELLDIMLAGGDTEGYRSYNLEGVFIDRIAVCDGISKAFCCLCRIEGIECYRVTGDRPASNISHAWNKAKLDGSWYVIDATSGGTVVGNEEIFSYRYFLMTDKQLETYSRPESGCYTDIVCDTEYDIYAVNGLAADSPEKAAALLNAFLEIAPEGCSSFEFKLTYPAASDSEAVQEILNALDRTVSMSYVGTDGIYCFIYKK